MWEKIRQGFQSFMVGRYGPDQLATALIWGGFALYLIGLLAGLGFLSILSFAVYIYAFYRILSRDLQKRSAENQKYMAFQSRLSTQWRQARGRFSGRKEYKYFRCPHCHRWLRLKRNVGEVTVTCSQCHHAFSKKA